MIDDLIFLFRRDLDTFIQNLEVFPDEKLWKVPDGVKNSSGMLAQHIVGNLNYFIGVGLGDTGYKRNRPQEFTNTGRSKKELINDLLNTQEMIEEVLGNFSEDELDNDYPLTVSYDYTTRRFLFHLYGHLSYHLGQLNYLRRLLSSG